MEATARMSRHKGVSEETIRWRGTFMRQKTASSRMAISGAGSSVPGMTSYTFTEVGH
jgi:hypothetical protein